MTSPPFRRPAGFTLIELVAVTAILAVLSVLAVGHFLDYRQEAQNAVVKNNMGVVREALGRYFKDRMEYPTNLDSLTGPYLSQKPFILLMIPLESASSALFVQVPGTDASPNAYLATTTIWEKYSFTTGATGQIRDFRIKLDSTLMPW